MSNSLAIAITAAPRARPALLPSMQSLRAAGFDESVTVLMDGDCGPFLNDGTTVIYNNPQLGTLANAFKGLEVMLEGGAQWVLLLEDDITWARGARDALVQELKSMPKNVGMLVLYTHPNVGRYLQKRHRAKQGYHDLPFGYNSKGAQALVFPRKAARALVDSDRRQCEGNRDRVIPGLLVDRKWRTLYRVPSLCNHQLGSTNSSVKGKKPQETFYFAPQARPVRIR